MDANQSSTRPSLLSRRFIRRAIVILCIAIVVLPVTGFFWGATIGPDYDPAQGYLALGLCVGGIVVPLILGAALAGEAIRRGGGLVGFLFAAGLVGAPTASLFGIQWLAALCVIALVLSVVLFFVIRSRSKAKVPVQPGTSSSDPNAPTSVPR